MHAALLATSAHSLAKTHFARLQSFISPMTATVDLLTSLREADNRVKAAEEDMQVMMGRANDAFGDLMYRMGNTSSSYKGKGVDHGAFDRDIIKERLAKLELLTEGTKSGSVVLPKNDQPPPPPSDPPPIPVTDPARPSGKSPLGQDVEMEDQPVKTLEEKRKSAKDLLRDVLKRLDDVEDARGELIVRCDELENLIWENAENGITPMSWDRLEDERLSFRSIQPMERPTKRMRRDRHAERTGLSQGDSLSGTGNGDDKEASGIVDLGGQESIGDSAGLSKLRDHANQSDRIESGHQQSEQNQVHKPDQQIASDQTDPIAQSIPAHPHPNSTPEKEQTTDAHSEIERLKKEVVTISGTLNDILKNQEEREKKLIRACLYEMHGSIVSVVKKVRPFRYVPNTR